MRFLTATLLVAACGAPAPLPTEPNPTQPTATRVVKAPPPPVEFLGVITTRNTQMIIAKVQGPLEALHIQKGDRVTKDTPVAEIGTNELKNRLAQAQANQKAAEMEAGSYGARLGALHKQVIAQTRLEQVRAASPMAVTGAKAEYGQAAAQQASAAARALSAKAEVDQAQSNLANATIKAPIDGVVNKVLVHQGQAVQYGTPLARVFDPSDFMVRFAVPSEQLAEVVRVGLVQLTIDGSPRPIWAQVTKTLWKQEEPINFTVVEADIDDTKLAPGELRVEAVARVRIAVAEGAKR